MQEYLWIIILVATILIELITVGNLLFIWFSFGALAAWLGQLLGFGLEIQIVLFAIVSLISLFFVRPIAHRYLREEVVNTNTDRLIGVQFELENDLLNDAWYQQRVVSDTWSIVSADNHFLKKGTMVEVIAIEGVKLVVRPLENKEN